MRIASALSAAGATDPGHYREVNEDRYLADPGRGLFLVVDGVGGQAAGGKAADTALAIVRARLERETGPITVRVREAITAANNEIHRLASTRAEWAGMACVLTAVVVHDGAAVIGHVGDTRLYKIRCGRIEKITRDHSPVGEREDAGELSELEAMRNPRRNEVYRDVGSDPHEPDDADFIDLFEIPFEDDAALLLCSDGLTDLVPSTTINAIVSEYTGRPDKVAAALVAAANSAGGKDNVTAVYVEGERFAADETRPLAGRAPTETPAPGRRQHVVRLAILTMLMMVLAAALARVRIVWPPVETPPLNAEALAPGSIVVKPAESLAAAIGRASRGAAVVVEPGEYRERIQLKDGVRLISRQPRGATIRLPSDATEMEPAVTADGVSGAELTGFRIVGDAATPLGTGLWIRNASVEVVDVEVTGAAGVAVDIRGMSGGTIVGSYIHDNPGAGLRVGSGAAPRIAHNAFVRNGKTAEATLSVLVETGASPRFSRNTFDGVLAGAFLMLDPAARTAVARDNWFIEPSAPREAPRSERRR